MYVYIYIYTYKSNKYMEASFDYQIYQRPLKKLYFQFSFFLFDLTSMNMEVPNFENKLKRI